MALSTCIKCGGSSFEMKEATPRGSAFVLMFVQCSSCGGVIGVIDCDNIGQLIHNLAKRLSISLS